MIRKLITLIFAVISMAAKAQNTNGITINSGWEFRKVMDSNWYSAAVPGTIHTDLMKHGIIRDPFTGDNEKHARWVENEDWEYRTYFSIPDEIFTKNHIELTFNGLDTWARVYLNDSLVLKADNMWRKWTVDVKRFLKKDRNLLYIYFESAVRKGKSLGKNLPYTLPGEERVFSRKSQCNYGWDWGPRLVTCGVWKNVMLEGWNDIKVTDVQLIQDSLSDHEAQLTASVQLISDAGAETTIRIRSKASGRMIKEYSSFLEKGKNIISFPFRIDKPIRWWCNGMGEPYLYHFTVETINGNHTDLRDIHVGLRTIELVQEKDSIGRTFYFLLNGVPVFMKGANYIPPDVFMPRVDTGVYLQVIDNAVKANMNMLRVWGGGNYESDDFYNFCDKKGILIWQDFMYACAMYPGDSAFIKNITKEAEEQVCRLRAHPCIALWCGNNEIDEGWRNWNWEKQFSTGNNYAEKIWNDYLRIFHQIIPETIQKHDPGSFYITSSPAIGWGRKESRYSGDMHYWGVWGGGEPFSYYKSRVGRFVSEYGFQGFPDMKTILDFAQPADMKLTSPVMLAHEKWAPDFNRISKYMFKDYKKPKDFGSYAYVSQLLQAYGIRTAIEAHRSARPYCMGTLYWQLNDCWPVISWSSMDSKYRWKALQYFVKDLYKDILVSADVVNDSIIIRVVNDRNETVKGGMKVKLMDFKGNILWEKPVLFPLKPLSSGVYFKIPLKEVVGKRILGRVFLYTVYKTYEGQEYKNIYYFAPPKSLKLNPPHVKSEVKTYNNINFIHLSTDLLAKNVFLSVDKEDVFFENNYFDLIPGMDVYVRFDTKADKETIGRNLKIKTLTDTY